MNTLKSKRWAATLQQKPAQPARSRPWRVREDELDPRGTRVELDRSGTLEERREVVVGQLSPGRVSPVAVTDAG